MKRYKRVSLVTYLYILPILVLIGIIFIYPLSQGLDNYRLIFSEPVFWKSVRSSLIWTFGNLILQLIIPLGVAILLNQKLKGMHFARTLILLPWIIPMVALAVSMRWMLLPGIGIFNEILKNTIGAQINFLGSQSAAMPTLIILNTWKWLPFGTLLILTALQTIPREVYEAARVDFMGYLILVWNFNTFDTIWLTTEGGPGHIMQTLTILVYRRAFKVFRLGEGAAIATMSAAFLMVMGILYFKFLSPKREDES